jgi:ABC-type molybdate transport system permease subunit
MDWGPLYLSLEAALLATVLAGLAGIAIGALLANPRTPGRHFFDAIVAAPMVMPPTVLGYYVLVDRRAARARSAGCTATWSAADLTFTFHARGAGRRRSARCR